MLYIFQTNNLQAKFINNIYTGSWLAPKISESQYFKAKKIIRTPLYINGNIQIININGQNIEKTLRKCLSISEHQVITGHHKYFHMRVNR